MKRRYCIFTLIFLFLSFLCCYNSVTAENLIRNGSFEVIDTNGIPEEWYTDAYISDQGYTVFKTISNEMAPDGFNYIQIHNIADNDARLAQKIEVKPQALYHISCKIKADVSDYGHGANISIEGLYVFSESIYNTDGDWETLEWYGETGENQDEIILYVRLGGYGGESAGFASFDMIEMEEVGELPDNIIASRWYQFSDFSQINDEQENAVADSPFYPLAIVISLLFIIIVLNIFKHFDNSDNSNKRQYRKKLIAVLLFSLLIRTFLSAMVEGYAVDVNCFLAWGNNMLQNGPAGFYQSAGFCDYPPAYIWILGLNSLVSKTLISVFSSVPQVIIYRIVFRFIPSVSDLLTCYILYCYSEKKNIIPKRFAFMVCSIVSILPVLILNSACWGQMDSVLCLFLILVAITAIEKKWDLCLPIYMLSVLIKPQALMLGFLGLAAIIMAYIKKTEERKKIAFGVLYSIIVACIIIVPYSLNQKNLFWIIDKYSDTLASYPYASVNTANIWYILGGNWKGIEGSIPVYYPIVFAVIGFVCALILYVKTEHTILKYIETCGILCFSLWNIIISISGTLNWNMVGIPFMVLSFVLIVPPFIVSGKNEMLPIFGGILFILLYVFGIKMHERYIIPAFTLVSLGVLFSKDSRRKILLLSIFGLALTVFINESIVLDNSIRLGASLGHLNNDTVWLADILAVMNIILSVISTITAYNMADKPLIIKDGKLKKRIIKKRIPVKEVREVIKNYDRKLYWKKKDTIILSCIVVLFSIITFSTLGSTKAPQTAWTSSDYEENIVFDLKDHYDDFSILYFSRVSRYDFSFSVSDDGENWSEDIWAQMDQGQCYRWKYVNHSWVDTGEKRNFVSTGSMSDVMFFSGRYVKMTAHQIGLNLCEVMFRDSSMQYIQTEIVSRQNAQVDSPNYSDPAALIDEPDSFEALPDYLSVGQKNTHPSWYNSTYFDEIYHARTAYEHLKGMVPYETSHPPLGKLLMSLSVSIFGMTPFGWRFAGALAGVLMLPALYLLAKQMTKKTWAGALAASLMALDCMHLTQTQIATIDSFPVLFIAFSFFFMLRFVQTDLSETDLKIYLPDLGLSGLFMGLAIASKWIGIYAGIGLAVMFFYHCIQFILSAKKTYKNDFYRQKNKLLITCLWCILFFVVVPVVIYLLSYIPYFSYDHSIHSISDYLEKVWNAQIGMLSYHSTPGLGMDHPFYSPWYEWPLSERPMYYAMKQYLDQNTYGLAIFCFGNPAVWYTGIIAIVISILFSVFDRRYMLSGHPERTWHIHDVNGSDTILFLVISLLAQFLPWVLVPRGTYIYHYFASIPFIILFIVFMFSRITQKRSRRFRIILLGIYLMISLCFFVLLFPYASGIMVPVEWLDIGKHILKLYY